MRTLSGLRDDLQRLDAQLSALAQAGDSPAVAAMSHGLIEMRSDLARQVLEASRARFDVVLDGAPVVGHEIRVDALSKLLHSLQESVSSIAQSLRGRATSSASLPSALRSETALNFSMAYPGSFGALLRGPEPAQVLPTLFDFLDDEGEQPATVEPTILDRAVQSVLSVLDLAGSEQVDDEPIVDAVLPLGSRAFKHLSELSAAIVDENLTARLVFVSPAVATRTTAVTKRSATRLRDVLGRNTETEEQVTIRGRLGSVSDIHNRIDLQATEGVINAKVTDELVPELGDFYTQNVLASFTVRSATSTVTGLVRRYYTLTGLAVDGTAEGGKGDRAEVGGN